MTTTPMVVNFSMPIHTLIEAVKDLKAANDNLRLELKAANDNYVGLKREVDVLKRAAGQKVHGAA